MNNTAYDLNNPLVVRQIGMEALRKALGPVGLAMFIRQFDNGYGDYTKERAEINGDLTVDEIAAEILAARK